MGNFLSISYFWKLKITFPTSSFHVICLKQCECLEEEKKKKSKSLREASYEWRDI